MVEYHEAIGNSSVHSCPSCGMGMKKLISAPNFKITSRDKSQDITAKERRERWNSPDPKVNNL